MKCGECLHFQKCALPSKGALCESLGIKRYMRAPSCFTPDYSKVVFNADSFRLLSSYLSGLSYSQKKILIAMLRMGPKSKQLEIGTKCYLCIGQDYLSNYFASYVVGYTSGGQLVVAGDPAKSRGRVFFAYLIDDKSVLYEQSWIRKKKELFRSGRLTAPSAKAKIDEDYEIPTIDKAPADKVPKVKRRTDTYDRIIDISRRG